ncbi:SKI family transcriptional corepressor 2-like [Frankliniella occidentalis]|uniref:SKI family transcriptional corepressor 2-like n=1 Tax=Frankliniella occidentalis TaxID=133901 RepID=A0A9C6TZL1_FRAOC|nr:SKI family transcriptional corepressor 2-like [Frankliniella occidentalis]
MRRLLQEAVRITATPAADGTPAPAMAAILRANASVAPGTTLGPLGVTLASTMPPLGPLDPPWPGSNNTNLTLAAVDDEFAEDLGYSDMQIVFLACVLTAGPLLAVLLSIVGVSAGAGGTGAGLGAGADAGASAGVGGTGLGAGADGTGAGLGARADAGASAGTGAQAVALLVEKQ